MKTLFGAAVILVSAPCACAYIEEIPFGTQPFGTQPFGTQPSPFSVNDWTPKSFKPKIRIRPMGDLGEAQPSDEEINIDANAEGIIRREYGAWLKRYGKTRSTKRFEIFKRNFIMQMEMNRKNGEFFLLNEYGDLTEDEYIAALRKSEHSKIEEQKEIKTSNEEKVYEHYDGTLPAAPVKQLEDLTQELLSTVMEDSRKSVAEELELTSATSTTTTRTKYAEMVANGEVQSETYLSQKMYTYLSDATRESAEAWENARSQGFQRRGTRSDSFLASYIDFVNTPMEQPDGFDLLPSLFSAAITSASQTIQSFLVQQEEQEEADLGGWEEYAYAMNFEDSNEYAYYYE